MYGSPRLVISSLCISVAACSAAPSLSGGATQLSQGASGAAPTATQGPSPSLPTPLAAAGGSAPVTSVPSSPNVAQPIASSGYYHIDTYTGLALTATESGAADNPLTTAPLAGSPNQRWYFRKVADDNYLAVNVASGNCIKVANPADGSQVLQASCNSADSAQLMSLHGGPNDTFELANTASNTCLDLHGESPSSAGQIVVYACDFGAHQMFSITPFRSTAAAGAFDWEGIIGTGQSLSLGVNGGAPLTTAIAGFYNLKLYDSTGAYDITAPLAPSLSVQPLVEPIRPASGANSEDTYPNNIAGETPHTIMGEQITTLMQQDGVPDYVTVHSCVGQGGQAMSVIGKGGTGNAYAASLFEAKAFANFAKQSNRRLGYRAIVLTHGEQDADNPAYEAAVEKLYSDYVGDLQAITGQSGGMAMFASQQHSKPGNSDFPYSTVALWQAGLHNPGKIFVTGPKYQYQYAGDGKHLHAGSYRALGEKYGEVYYRVMHKNEAWKPLQPSTVTWIKPTQLQVSFDIPNPPLAFDDTLPQVHQTANTAWAHGRGFEVLDSAGRQVTIASVVLTDSAAGVLINLATAPSRPITLQYAITQDGTNGFFGGSSQGRAGQLRDSDPFVGLDQQVIACQVTQGSTLIACPAGLSGRTLHDIVVEAGAAIASLPSTTQATLTAPWKGSSGKAALTVHALQYNYLVAFSEVVP